MPSSPLPDDVTILVLEYDVIVSEDVSSTPLPRYRVPIFPLLLFLSETEIPLDQIVCPHF